MPQISALKTFIEDQARLMSRVHNGKVALRRLFSFYYELIRQFSTHYGMQYTVLSLEIPEWIWVLEAIDRIKQTYPLSPHSVFQDNGVITEIDADVWRESVVHKDLSKEEAGIILMHFAKGCNKLPLHIHPFSDRILFIIEGEGFGHYAFDDIADLKADSIASIKVKAGTLIYFPRNTVHTFSTGDSTLTTLTFHSPFVEFEDERSFEKYRDWYPPCLP